MMADRRRGQVGTWPIGAAGRWARGSALGADLARPGRAWPVHLGDRRWRRLRRCRRRSRRGRAGVGGVACGGRARDPVRGRRAESRPDHRRPVEPARQRWRADVAARGAGRNDRGVCPPPGSRRPAAERIDGRIGQ